MGTSHFSGTSKYLSVYSATYIAGFLLYSYYNTLYLVVQEDRNIFFKEFALFWRKVVFFGLPGTYLLYFSFNTVMLVE